jgi:hypothetical protein
MTDDEIIAKLTAYGSGTSGIAEVCKLAADRIASMRDVIADQRRLAREIDVAMHGEEGAALSPSLCDLVEPARQLRARASTPAPVNAEQMRTAIIQMIRKTVTDRGYAILGARIERDIAALQVRKC